MHQVPLTAKPTLISGRKGAEAHRLWCRAGIRHAAGQAGAGQGGNGPRVTAQSKQGPVAGTAALKAGAEAEAPHSGEGRVPPGAPPLTGALTDAPIQWPFREELPF